MKSLALLLVVGLVDGFFFPKIKTVEQLDINKYTGRWYEVRLYIGIFRLQMRAPSVKSQERFQTTMYCFVSTYLYFILIFYFLLNRNLNNC